MNKMRKEANNKVHNEKMLDLTFLTSRIIIAGKIWNKATDKFRFSNNFEELAAFLNVKFSDRYMIWSSRDYASSPLWKPFKHQIVNFPFGGPFNFPTIETLYSTVYAMYCWLSISSDTVVVLLSNHDDDMDEISSVPSIIIATLFTIFDFKLNMKDAFQFCQRKRNLADDWFSDRLKKLFNNLDQIHSNPSSCCFTRIMLTSIKVKHFPSEVDLVDPPFFRIFIGQMQRDLDDVVVEGGWNEEYLQECNLYLQGDFTIVCYDSKKNKEIIFSYQDTTFTYGKKMSRLDLSWPQLTHNVSFSNIEHFASSSFKITLIFENVDEPATPSSSTPKNMMNFERRNKKTYEYYSLENQEMFVEGLKEITNRKNEDIKVDIESFDKMKAFISSVESSELEDLYIKLTLIRSQSDIDKSKEIYTKHGFHFVKKSNLDLFGGDIFIISNDSSKSLMNNTFNKEIGEINDIFVVKPSDMKRNEGFYGEEDKDVDIGDEDDEDSNEEYGNLRKSIDEDEDKYENKDDKSDDDDDGPSLFDDEIPDFNKPAFTVRRASIKTEKRLSVVKEINLEDKCFTCKIDPASLRNQLMKCDCGKVFHSECAGQGKIENTSNSDFSKALARQNYLSKAVEWKCVYCTGEVKEVVSPFSLTKKSTNKKVKGDIPPEIREIIASLAKSGKVIPEEWQSLNEMISGLKPSSDGMPEKNDVKKAVGGLSNLLSFLESIPQSHKGETQQKATIGQLQEVLSKMDSDSLNKIFSINMDVFKNLSVDDINNRLKGVHSGSGGGVNEKGVNEKYNNVQFNEKKSIAPTTMPHFSETLHPKPIMEEEHDTNSTKPHFLKQKETSKRLNMGISTKKILSEISIALTTTNAPLPLKDDPLYAAYLDYFKIKKITQSVERAKNKLIQDKLNKPELADMDESILELDDNLPAPKILALKEDPFYAVYSEYFKIKKLTQNVDRAKHKLRQDKATKSECADLDENVLDWNWDEPPRKKKAGGKDNLLNKKGTWDYVNKLDYKTISLSEASFLCALKDHPVYFKYFEMLEDSLKNNGKSPRNEAKEMILNTVKDVMKEDNQGPTYILDLYLSDKETLFPFSVSSFKVKDVKLEAENKSKRAAQFTSMVCTSGSGNIWQSIREDLIAFEGNEKAFKNDSNFKGNYLTKVDTSKSKDKTVVVKEPGLKKKVDVIYLNDGAKQKLTTIRMALNNYETEADKKTMVRRMEKFKNFVSDLKQLKFVNMCGYPEIIRLCTSLVEDPLTEYYKSFPVDQVRFEECDELNQYFLLLREVKRIVPKILAVEFYISREEEKTRIEKKINFQVKAAVAILENRGFAKYLQVILSAVRLLRDCNFIRGFSLFDLPKILDISSQVPGGKPTFSKYIIRYCLVNKLGNIFDFINSSSDLSLVQVVEAAIKFDDFDIKNDIENYKRKKEGKSGSRVKEFEEKFKKENNIRDNAIREGHNREYGIDGLRKEEENVLGGDVDFITLRESARNLEILQEECLTDYRRFDELLQERDQAVRNLSKYFGYSKPLLMAKEVVKVVEKEKVKEKEKVCKECGQKKKEEKEVLVPVVVEIKHSEQYFFKFFDEMLKKICIDYREEKELFDKEEKEKSAIRRNSHVIISRTNSVEKFL